MCPNPRTRHLGLLLIPLIILLTLDRNVAMWYYGEKSDTTNKKSWTKLALTADAIISTIKNSTSSASSGASNVLTANETIENVKHGLHSSTATRDRIQEEDTPTSTSAKNDVSLKTDSFAGCLLTMDDYYRLSEFLAYHYHVLPLRYLVVAVDPNSKTDPNPIFERFRSRLNMTIVVWNDTDVAGGDPFFLAKMALPNVTSGSTNVTLKDYTSKKLQYLSRQRRFIQMCLAHLKDMGQTWTAIWDMDEYIVPNHRPGRTPPTGLSTAPPNDVRTPGSVLSYLLHNASSDIACVPMLRTIVGANVTDAAVLNNETNSTISTLFDLNQFDTIRFRLQNKGSNGFGKSMLNIQKIPTFPVAVKNTHRPAAAICPRPVIQLTHHSPFYLQHYISSWDMYSFRDDSRKGGERNRVMYASVAFPSPTNVLVYEDMIVSWLDAFVTSVGLETAQYVLQETGLPSNYTAPASKLEEFACIIVGKCT